MVKEWLVKLRDKIAELKFYFDISVSLLTVVNLALLVIAASDKLRVFIPLGTFSLMFIFVPAVLLGALAFGWFLDKVVNYQASYYKEVIKRNPQIIEILDRVKNIEKIVGEKNEGQKN